MGEAEEKRKRLEEAEKKRQAMMQAQKEKQSAGDKKGGAKKTDGGGMGNVQDARREMTKTKEQLEEEKKISLSIRIKPLELDGMDGDALKEKAIKLGLDPEALTGKYPPKIRMYSKYERRTDTRTYEDRRRLYEGGWEVLYSESLEKSWKEKMEDWKARPKSKLPKWFGERPGKKPGEPESPEDDEEGGEAAPAEVEEEEEEEEEEKKKKKEEEEEE